MGFFAGGYPAHNDYKEALQKVIDNMMKKAKEESIDGEINLSPIINLCMEIKEFRMILKQDEKYRDKVILWEKLHGIDQPV